jgi:hypothetical protein
MDVNLLAGALAGLVLSALLVTSRAECAEFLLSPVSERERWTPPVSGFVTGTGLFIAVASLWLLRVVI